MCEFPLHLYVIVILCKVEYNVCCSQWKYMYVFYYCLVSDYANAFFVYHSHNIIENRAYLPSIIVMPKQIIFAQSY